MDSITIIQKLQEEKMKRSAELTKFLIESGSDIHHVDNFGAQPLHIACLFNNHITAEILLSAGADPDAELTQGIFSRYGRNQKLPDEFSKMTLLVLAIINNQNSVFEVLLNYGANFRIKSKTNQTLLMLAAENYTTGTRMIELLISKMKNSELINARDDNNFHVIHYIIFNKQFHRVRYDFVRYSEFILVANKLIEANANVDATVNGDPGTLLINFLAQRSVRDMLIKFLNINVPLNEKSRALYYASLPIDTKKFTDQNISELMGKIEEKRQNTIEIVVRNYCLRREYGLFVPEEEKKLMDQMIAKDLIIKKLVDSIEIFTFGLQKKLIIEYKDNSLSFYELIVRVSDNTKLKILVEDENLVKAAMEFCNKYLLGDDTYSPFCKFIVDKLKTAWERKKFLEEFEKIYTSVE